MAEENGKEAVVQSSPPMVYEVSRTTKWPVEYHVDTIENTKYPNAQNRPAWGVLDGDIGEGRLLFCASGVSGRGPYRVDGTFPERLKVPMDLSGIDEEACDLLYGLVRALRPRCCLETGTHKGRSTLAILTALAKNNQGHLYTLDIFKYVELRKTIPPVMSNRVTQIVGRSPEAFHCAPLVNLNKIDFAFLDGAHDGATLLKELEFVDAHRDKTCYVCVDNALDAGWPEVRQTLDDYIPKHPLHAVLETMSGMDIICMRDDVKLKPMEGATTTIVVEEKQAAK